VCSPDEIVRYAKTEYLRTETTNSMFVTLKLMASRSSSTNFDTNSFTTLGSIYHFARRTFELDHIRIMLRGLPIPDDPLQKWSVFSAGENGQTLIVVDLGGSTAATAAAASVSHIKVGFALIALDGTVLRKIEIVDALSGPNLGADIHRALHNALGGQFDITSVGLRKPDTTLLRVHNNSTTYALDTASHMFVVAFPVESHLGGTRRGKHRTSNTSRRSRSRSRAQNI